jgi:uncharacterized protein YbjT (DUF2867 family)
MKKVLVTGATGKIGSRLITGLVKHDNIKVRAFIRNAEKAAPLEAKGAELAMGTFENEEAVNAAVKDIHTIVLITTQNPAASEQASAMVHAAKKNGVKKIIRISVFKAAVDGPAAITRLHGHTDNEIQNSGLDYIILRPPFFMQNLFFMAATKIISEDRFYFGTGEGKIGMIDLRDIADCAEQCIISDKHDNKIFTLTGPESLSFYDIAGRLSNIMGRTIRYVDVSPEAVGQSILTLGMGDWYAQVMGDLCSAYRENWGDVIMADVAQITGHRPRSFDQFAGELFVPALKSSLTSLRPLRKTLRSLRLNTETQRTKINTAPGKRKG